VPATATSASVYDDLGRILSLEQRPVLNCERDLFTRRWAPEAQAMIDVVTARYSRARLSCGCRDRVVEALGGGRLVVFQQGKPGNLPPPPREFDANAFLIDNGYNKETVKAVSGLSKGQSVRLKGLDRPCITQFNPVQAWILRELPRAGGILGFVAIGGGKSIASMLSPLALWPKVRTVALLAKPDQRLHYQKHYLHIREHFRVPSIIFDGWKTPGAEGSIFVEGTPAVHFVPYSILQQMKSTNLLSDLNPDMIVADEAHCLSAGPTSRRRASTRASRFLAYLTKRSGVHVCAWSGSLINKSLYDLTHIAAHCLGLGSPYPIMPKTVEEWALVLDPSHNADRKSPTAKKLRQVFGQNAVELDDAMFFAGMDSDGGVRVGLRKRVVQTLGVISTKSASVSCSISIKERKAPPVPQAIRDILVGIRNESILHVGDFEEVLVEKFEVTAAAKEVAAGFYNFWAFPKHPCSCPTDATSKQRCDQCQLIDEWFLRRKAWNKELRNRLMRPAPHLDSSALCANAAERAWRNPPYDGGLPVWSAETWQLWAEIKDKVESDPRHKWIDEYLAQDAANWALEHTGIVWYHSRAFGKKVSQLAGIPFHDGGDGAEARILAEKGDRSIVASISSHSEGRDGLQFKFCKQLVAEPPSSGKGWDQLLGRLAREGQEADCIETWCYRHVPEFSDAFAKAITLAEFDEEMSPTQSLLLASDIEF